MRPSRILLVAAASLLMIAPAAFATLSGSGQVNDIVQLSTDQGTVNLVASGSGGSASASPITSGSTAFTMTNSGSNVETLIRYGWGTTPYYGPSSASTSITIRLTSHNIADLLWFQQQTLDSALSATSSQYYSPLVLKASGVAPTTFTSSTNACTAWSDTPGSGFTKTAAGTITFRYYPTSSQSNDDPTLSDAYHYCLDVSGAQMYIGKAASFSSAIRIYNYATQSTGGVVKDYRVELKPNSVTTGNHYCLNSIVGTGTSATPELVQCQRLPYELGGSTTAKLYVLLDPPAYFPSVNQGGTVTYAVAGTQWNPYASSTTNTA